MIWKFGSVLPLLLLLATSCSDWEAREVTLRGRCKQQVKEIFYRSAYQALSNASQTAWEDFVSEIPATHDFARTGSEGHGLIIRFNPEFDRWRKAPATGRTNETAMAVSFRIGNEDREFYRLSFAGSLSGINPSSFEEFQAQWMTHRQGSRTESGPALKNQESGPDNDSD